MSYFSEATNILQRDQEPTTNRVIPVVDSLENALRSISRDSAAKNALCECLLNSLQKHFFYLLDSSLHQAATALDPRVKLTFTDNSPASSGKIFNFKSSVVKEKVKELLPEADQTVTITGTVDGGAEPSRKKSLLDFSSASQRPNVTNVLDAEIETYFSHLTLDIHPLKFWTEKRDSLLHTLALQLLSVPCSSASVERLFSKAGIVLSQRRSRLQSSLIEQLLFFK